MPSNAEQERKADLERPQSLQGRRGQGQRPRKRARLTVSPQEIFQGKRCSCGACLKDGQHEPDCRVHDEPPGNCSCDRAEQAQAAG